MYSTLCMQDVCLVYIGTVLLLLHFTGTRSSGIPLLTPPLLKIKGHFLLQTACRSMSWYVSIPSSSPGMVQSNLMIPSGHWCLFVFLFLFFYISLGHAAHLLYCNY